MNNRILMILACIVPALVMFALVVGLGALLGREPAQCAKSCRQGELTDFCCEVCGNRGGTLELSFGPRE